MVDIADVNYNDWIRGKNYRTIPTRDSQFLRTKTTNGKTKISTAVAVTYDNSITSDITYLTLNNAKFDIKNTVISKNNPVNYTYNEGGIETPDGTYLGGITVTIDFNYKTNTFEGAEFGGDAKDGLAFFTVADRGFAGILDTTNLGRPLTQTTGKTTWRGQLGFISRREISSYDFVLTITFNGTGGEVLGSATDVVFGSFTSDFFTDGDFNSQGLISGRAYFGSRNANGVVVPTSEDRSGIFTGLIGQEGAIGAFRGGRYTYSGGFAVHPDVTDKVVYADWVRAYSDPGVKKDNDGRLIPSIPGPTDFDSAVVLRGIFDNPVQGNHFLTTKNDEIALGRKLTEDDSGLTFEQKEINFYNLITEQIKPGFDPRRAVTPTY
ncbi:MAG: hypothetical protein K8953_12795, partial [Proteobacteria bacterium]|nr:hypothetical protein [Pseudomonadota bacterium]